MPFSAYISLSLSRSILCSSLRVLYFHSESACILSLNLSALLPTCVAQRLSIISTAAVDQLLSFTAAINFLNFDNLGAPILKHILTITCCASSGSSFKLGNTFSDSLIYFLTSSSNTALTRSSLTG